MTEPSLKPERRFARDWLPWVVGAAVLAVYLVTVNHSVTLSNLSQVSMVSGWNWRPTLAQPLLVLVTYPFRFLPVTWVPLALNCFTAFCAALTLALLARSVALLPHDRLEQQRLLAREAGALLSLPDAWVPMALAAGALGLQLTFWENAIAASGEMLDLLLFAYVIRCLLEHRIEGRQSWLDRAALVFGVALANNWAMAGFFPLFVVAVLRTKRLRFFNVRSLQRLEQYGWERAKLALRADVGFFLRMALLGLGGLSLFLLLPLVQAFRPDSVLSFWQALLATAAGYKSAVGFVVRVLRYHRDIALLLAATSLLPVLVLSIRWGASATGGGRAGPALVSGILLLSHACLLLTCLVTLFDPPFSPRQIGQLVGLRLPFLPLYYLCALSLGYYSGFFLLLFGPSARWGLRQRERFQRAACLVVPKLVYVLAGLALAGLALKNAPAIRAANAPHLDRYARLAASSLPPDGAIVLGDDRIRVGILQAALTRVGNADHYVAVEMRDLPSPPYRAWLQRRYPGRLQGLDLRVRSAQTNSATLVTNGVLNVFGLVQVVSQLVRSNHVYCLQLPPGFWREPFDLRPRGLLQEMTFYPSNSFGGPPLSAAELAENQAFWRRAKEESINPLLQVAAKAELPRPAVEEQVMRWAHLQTPPPPTAKVTAWWYSSALDQWGVTLQRNDQLKEAGSCFALALQLRPENLAARINSQCNSNLLAGHSMTIQQGEVPEELATKYRSWPEIIADNGPFDDPRFCLHLGLWFAASGLVRQAGQELERAQTLAPGDPHIRLLLGSLFTKCGMPDRALQLATQMQTDPRLKPLDRASKVQLALMEATAWFAKTNRSKADEILASLLKANPEDPMLLNQAGTLFTAWQSYSNALEVADRILQLSPNNVSALVNKGTVAILMGDYSNAIPPLNRALSLTNSCAIRFDRALAYLRGGRLDEAKADYQAILQALPTAYAAYQGLGEVACLEGNTNAAIGYYQEYLSKAVAGSREARFAAARLKSLQQGQR